MNIRTSVFSLLAALGPASPANAALSNTSVSEPETPDIITGGFEETVDLSTGIDWLKYQGGSSVTKKSGTSYLTVSQVGSFTPGTFTPASGHLFTWNGGTPTASGSNRVHANGSPLPNLGGWQAEITDLSAGSYQLELSGARTRATAFSVELYEGNTFLTRRTVNGAAESSGTSVGAVKSVIRFTVDGPSDIARVRFIRDTTNGVNTAVSGTNILAIGAWRLSEAPDAPVISVDSSFSFSTGLSPLSLEIPCKNTGISDPLVIGEITLAGADAGCFTVNGFTTPVTAGGSGTVSLLFTPSSGSRIYRASLKIHTNDPVTPTAVTNLAVEARAIRLGRLLCIGDSITEGKATRPSGEGNHSWRYPFWKRLVENGIGVRFVGTRTANNGGSSVYPGYLGESFANRHEAIWGTTSLERGNNAATYLPALANLGNVPDRAVVFLGGNDVPTNLSVSAATVRDRIKTIVDRLQGDVGSSGNPDIDILLVSILPRFTGTGYTTPDGRNNRFREINGLLKNLAEEETTPASRVSYLDAASGFAGNPGVLYDGVHPNGAGEEILGELIFGALVPDRDADGLPDAWEEHHFENISVSNGKIDSDGDGTSDRDEFLFGTHPLEANPPTRLSFDQSSSLLRFTLPAASGPGGEGKSRRYTVQQSTNLIDWQEILTGIATGAEVTVPIEITGERCFYLLRVGVE